MGKITLDSLISNRLFMFENFPNHNVKEITLKMIQEQNKNQLKQL